MKLPLIHLLASVVALGASATTAAEPIDADAAACTARIDRLFAADWLAQQVTPAEPTSDSEFLRRVTLDLTGVIPDVGEVRAFLADESADKRARCVEQLLRRPRHAAHLANIWSGVLLPQAVEDSAARGFERWLQAQFAANVPYDALARDILLARGRLGQSPPAMYYAALESKPSELAASSSRVFLGIQIRCAECHDHPFTDWKQDDFWGLAAFFARVTGPDGGMPLGDSPTGELQHPKTMQTVVPVLFDGTPLLSDAAPRRQALADWITAPDNPYFASAAVNRIWSILFGRGLVDPVDDLGEHNPPSHPDVLRLLADDFRRHGCDLRRTFRIIAGTRAYQLSSVPAGGAQSPLEQYAVMPVRSLSAEQIYDCLLQASGRREPLNPTDESVLAERAAFLAQIEAPTRQATEFQGGIPQSLVLLNGPLTARLTDPWSGDRVVALMDSPFLDDAARVEAVYLAALARPPDPDERAAALEWMHAGGRRDPGQALGDLLWALLNSSEFILNH